jgi:hypothetical protein
MAMYQQWMKSPLTSILTEQGAASLLHAVPKMLRDPALPTPALRPTDRIFATPYQDFLANDLLKVYPQRVALNPIRERQPRMA